MGSWVQQQTDLPLKHVLVKRGRGSREGSPGGQAQRTCATILTFHNSSCLAGREAVLLGELAGMVPGIPHAGQGNFLLC